MNIIWVDPEYRRGRVYPLYSGVYDQLKKIVKCSLSTGSISNIGPILKKAPFKPDAIVFGLGWHKEKFWGKIKGLRKLDIPIICQIFKPQNSYNEKLKFCKVNNFDAVLTPAPCWMKLANIPTRRFCYGADPKVFRDRKLAKVYDFGFSGALHNAKHYKSGFKVKNLRCKAHDILKSQNKISCFLNGSDSIRPRISNQEEYAIKISQSKMWLSTPAAFDDMPARFFEIGMSKTLIVCSKVPDKYKDIFRDGENCVEFSDDMSDFLDKIHYYLENPKKAKAIIDCAFSEFHKHHTWKNRAQELLEIIKTCR